MDTCDQDPRLIDPSSLFGTPGKLTLIRQQCSTLTLRVHLGEQQKRRTPIQIPGSGIQNLESQNSRNGPKPDLAGS